MRPVADAKPLSAEGSLLAAVSAERLLARTAVLSAEVRLSGSPAEERAFDYIANEMADLGLDVRRYRCEALISLPVAASLTILGSTRVTLPCITHSFSLSTGGGGLEAELIDIGHGDDEEYRAKDVSGKIIVMDGLAGPGVVRQAERHGCTAQIFVNPGLRHEMIVSPVWGNPVTGTRGMLPGSVCVTVDDTDGARLRSALRAGPVRALIETQVDTGWRSIPLVTADLRGPGSDDTFVLFGAHVDSWHHGATDNATGNAAQLEIARILASRRPELRRGVRFAFWSGHSHGRYAGSSWYADHCWRDLYDRALMYVNLDTPGGRGATVLGLIDVMGETLGLVSGVVSMIAGQDVVGKRIARYADQSFWGIGLPSALASVSEQPVVEGVPSPAGPGQAAGSKHASGGLGYWWHTTEDTLDKVDAENLRRDTQICLLTIWRTITGVVLPFDYPQVACDVLTHLDGLPATGVDLGPLRGLAERLLDATERLAKCATGDVDVGQADLLNTTLRRLGRALIPTLYTVAGPFEQDPALPQGFLPGLADIERLAALDPASDEAAVLRTGLVRQRNRIATALIAATAIAQEAATALSMPPTGA